MKPDWDKLGAMYEGSPNVVIADVDCTAESSKTLCEKQEVKSYPTIKYFTKKTGPEGEKYDKGRSLGELKKFVKGTLKGKMRVCNVETKDDCTQAEVAYLETLSGKSLADVEAELAAFEKKLEDVLKAEVRKDVESKAKVLKLVQKAKKKKGEL
mmetsp:Transcript_93883/g.265202  ORF Transcript_93883/g.265202 Transcript_93883/m.265202 type:complete len:154 (-) Transcript_93883:300-761(-)